VKRQIIEKVNIIVIAGVEEHVGGSKMPHVTVCLLSEKRSKKIVSEECYFDLC
jgi:hypothetical protein